MSKCTCQFETILQYSSPARGGWSIVRYAMQVPESYQLFVGPAACMRHIMLSSMELKIDHRISWLFIKESDIVSGSYEQLILKNVDELLSQMTPRPKVFMIFTTCIDNLLGTDHDVFLKPLNEKYPDTKTIVCFMNPITGEGPTPPAITIQDSIYSLLKKSEVRERAVNCIGNHLPIREDNELICHLKQHGFQVRHISQYQSFEQFQEMGQSVLNLVLSPLALYAAKQMKKRQGIDYLYLPVSYSFAEIEKGIQLVCDKLDIEPLDPTDARRQAEQALEETRKELNGRPVSLDYEATYHPFSMAHLLLTHGFHLDTIFSGECIPQEQREFDWILERHPEVNIVQPDQYTMLGKRRNEEDHLCIGFEAAYYIGSPHVVPVAADAEQYGFSGICLLMKRMAEENARSYDLEQLVKDSGLVV